MTEIVMHKCPGLINGKPCTYTSQFKAAVMNHIVGNHPGVWKGNWDATMGIPGAKPGRSKRAYKRNKTVERPVFDFDTALAEAKTTTEKERLKKRQEGALRRAANIAKGLTSGGLPRKFPLRKSYLKRHGLLKGPEYLSHTSEYKKRRYREQVARYHAMGLNAHGEPFKNTNLARAQRARRQREAVGKRMEPIVYRAPEPEEDRLKTAMEELRRKLSFHLTHCPNCGLNLVQIQEALQKQQQQKEQNE